MQLHLLVRPKRYEQEHSHGHLLRTAYANGVNDPRWLAGLRGLPLHSRVRVCPACLARVEPFWLNAWSDRQRPLCTDHRSWLVDQCSGCARSLRWSSVRFLSCRCGQDLRELVAWPLAPEARFAVLKSDVPLQVLLWLGSLGRCGLAGKPLKRATRQSMSEVIDLAQLGATMISDWPGAFFRTLDERRIDGRAAQSLTLLNEALPGLTKRIGMIRSVAWRRRIMEALGDYVASSLQTQAPLIGRNVRGRRPPTVMSIAREMGVRPERLTSELDRAAETGVAVRRTAGGRCRRVISPEVIATTRRSLDDQITRKQAARLLGLTAARVQQLVVGRQLGMTRKRLSRSEVLALRASLTDVAVLESRPADAVTLCHALQFWLPLYRTCEVLDALLAGELILHRSPRTGLPTQNFVSQAQVQRWASEPPTGERVWSIPEVAQRLHLKQEVIYHLVRVGLIQTQTARVGRRLTRVVTRAVLEEFEKQFEPLARTLARHGVDHRRGVSWAGENKLELVSGPRIDGGRQYFVRRGTGDVDHQAYRPATSKAAVVPRRAKPRDGSGIGPD
jgi:hypothetical protein